MQHWPLRLGVRVLNTKSAFVQRYAAFRQQTWDIKLRRIGGFAFRVVNFLCAIHLFSENVGRISLMEGPSMLPTFNAEGDIVIEDRFSIKFFPSKIERGELVTLKSPIEPNRVVCKRIIGLPGDVVCVDPTGEKAPSTEHIIIPKGHIWVSGDNAAASRDSRDYGPVSMSLLQSKIIAKVWPSQQFAIFKSNMTYIG